MTEGMKRLQAGDRMIMGSIVQLPIAAGDKVIADLGALGRVGLAIARRRRSLGRHPGVVQLAGRASHVNGRSVA